MTNGYLACLESGSFFLISFLYGLATSHFPSLCGFSYYLFSVRRQISAVFIFYNIEPKRKLLIRSLRSLGSFSLWSGCRKPGKLLTTLNASFAMHRKKTIRKSANNQVQMKNNPLSFLRGGDYRYDSGSANSGSGRYWGSKINSNTNAHHLYFDSTIFVFQRSSYKGYGLSIRCLVG